jgi:hypothetical protein
MCLTEVQPGIRLKDYRPAPAFVAPHRFIHQNWMIKDV